MSVTGPAEALRRRPALIGLFARRWMLAPLAFAPLARQIVWTDDPRAFTA